MSTSAAARLQARLQSLGEPPLSEDQAEAFSAYLGLFLKWNAKLNLSAIRDEEEIISRHFIESIACARLLPLSISALLDYGSGGGFPGLPCAICRPEMRITLAESQSKKAAFLQECARRLALKNVAVHGRRVEDLPMGKHFDAITLRAVDRMEDACQEALSRLVPGGWLVILATCASLSFFVEGLQGMAWRAPVPLAGTTQEVVLVGRKLHG